MATTDMFQPPETVSGLRRLGMASALVGVVLTILGFVMSGGDRFFEAYLVAYVFWAGVALGSLAILMVIHLTGGAWGLVIRRPLEAATRTIPLMALLFIPILLGMGHLYEWTNADVVANDPIIREKVAYLNAPFFIVRQVIYWTIWSALALLLNRWSAEQDRTGDPALIAKFSKLSGGGLVVHGLILTFAMVDWVMSINPHWFSTIWGMLFLVGQALSALAFAIVVLIMLSQYPPLNRIVTAHHLHDLGKLLFAFLMLWAYLSFSQFLIIWSANTVEEIPHYFIRLRGGYQWLGAGLILLHFAVPYALLLSRDLKRDVNRLRLVAGWLVFIRLLDYFWYVSPEFHTERFTLSLLDVALPIAIGGVFLALYAAQLGARPLLPLNDPGLEKALHHHVH
ncbi:MAG TPA: hypothetical protein VEK56_04120 [Vicinamibacterales bacterium]|nr:hypothetical protein [Vicinamibacterales bacterium]